jgi:exonuclease SbcD
MKLLHAADLHLGAAYSGFGSLGPERGREVLDAFRRLPEVAAEERVDAVMVAGDLFDSPRPGTETLAAVRETLRRFMDACIPVFLVPGNHDAVTLRFSPYRELARGSRVVEQRDGAARRSEKHSVYILVRPHFAAPVTVETEGGPLHVYGIAYDPAECRDPIATFARKAAPGVHVMLLHASVRAADHWQGSNSLVLPTRALDGIDVDYIALGDHHRPRTPSAFGGTAACYPGSFAATDLSEAGPRGYVLVELTPGRPPEVEHRDAGVTPVAAVEVDVTGLTDDIGVAEAAIRLAPARAVPAVHLVGEPAFPLDTDVVTAELIERYGHAAVVDGTRFYASERLDELAGEDTVAGHVVRLARHRIDQAEGEEQAEIERTALRLALRALEVD